MGSREIAVSAMDVLRNNIQEGMKARGKNATGNTSRRLVVLPSGGEGAGFGQAALEADSQWKFVGNGRAPGGMPPIQNIRNWIQARGLSLNAFAVARKIAKQGSRDFRLKRTNVFLDEIKAWEKNDVPKAEEQLAKGLEDRVTSLIDQTIKRNG